MMNTDLYIDHKIIGRLKIVPSQIEDYPVETFRKEFSRKHSINFDPFSEKPLFTRRSRSLELTRELKDDDMWKILYELTIIMVRLLREENVQGEVVLYYKFLVNYLDAEIECGAFKPSENE